MRAWYTVTVLKTPTDQQVIFDGQCREYFAAGLAKAAHDLSGMRVVVTRGKDVGKFVAEIAAR